MLGQRIAFLGAGLGFLLATSGVAAPAAESCGDQTAFIESQSRCAGEEGIPLSAGANKASCFADPTVQNTCGPEGRVTRLHAFTAWLRQLKEFQNHCADQGGEFTFADARFTEPSDENFCSPSQPELGSSFFEEPTCNFRSLCPTVEVVCQRSCSRHEERAAARETADLIADNRAH